MQAFVVALIIGLFLPGQKAQSDVSSHVQQFIAAFNKGDMKTAIAACAPDVSIVDEFAPNEWHGAGSMTRWLNDYGKDAAKRGITDGKVTLGKARHIDVDGDHAYVIYDANYTFKQKGKPVGQPGSMFTLALKKVKGSWKITAWTWSKG